MKVKEMWILEKEVKQAPVAPEVLVAGAVALGGSGRVHDQTVQPGDLLEQIQLRGSFPRCGSHRREGSHRIQTHLQAKRYDQRFGRSVELPLGLCQRCSGQSIAEMWYRPARIT